MVGNFAEISRYCPQHNALWNDLTIFEHLLFYVRLRGNIPKLEESSHVTQIVKAVGKNHWF